MNITKDHSAQTKSHGENFGEEAKMNTMHNETSGNIEAIEGTPFAIFRKSDNESYNLVMGKYMVTNETFETKEKAKEWTIKEDFNSILNVVAAYVEMHWEIKEAEKKAKLNEITKL